MLWGAPALAAARVRVWREMREGLPPCPTTLCVWRNLPYLTLNRITARGRGVRRVVVTFQEREGMAHMHLRAFERVIKA